MLCRHCAKYGHTARNCRTQKARCLRCSGKHPMPDCNSDRRHCPHCSGNHATWERSCPVLQDHFATEKNRQPPPKPTYAEAATQVETIGRDAIVQTRASPKWTESTQTKKILAKTTTTQTINEDEQERSLTPQPQYARWSPLQTRKQRQTGAVSRPTEPPPRPPPEAPPLSLRLPSGRRAWWGARSPRLSDDHPDTNFVLHHQEAQQETKPTQQVQEN